MTRPSVVTVALAATVFILGFLGAHDTSAEVRSQLAQQFRSDPYVIELDKMLEEWNGGSLRFPPKSQLAAELAARLKKTVETKRYAYHTNDWASTLKSTFDAMPSDLRPEVKLSDSAALILMHLFAEGLEEFKRQVQVGRVRNELSVPLFMILARAQEIAKSRDRRQIDSRVLLGSLTSWWTAIWPFCD